MEASKRSSAWSDLGAASAICFALTLVWTLRSWSDLNALRLPDPDDLMRLQQIRDWLGGQRFADLTQYRLGYAGTPMHWSRLPDLVPAAMIWSLQGLVGRHASEVAAVILWPASLFVCAIALSGRIARSLAGGGVAGAAMIIAAIAFPVTTVFVPGRIDHHGLQLVLLLIAVLMLVKRPSLVTGVTGGIVSVASLMVGMELAPVLAAAAAFVVGEWVIRGDAARPRLGGFGVAFAVTTLVGTVAFRTLAWDYPACDAFTALSARAMLIASLMPIVLAAAPASNRKARAILAGLAGIAVVVAIGGTAPQCLSPYGQVPPLLQQLWLSRVTEAQLLFAAPVATAVAYSGLMIAGLVAGGWCVWRTRDSRWLALLLLQLAAAAVTLVQLRGAYAGALLAAPALAAFVVRAQRVGLIARAAAWAASAGILYPIAAQAMTAHAATTAKASCTAPDLMAALGRLPAGRVMAPVDTAAPAIVSTKQQLLAGAYHRDAGGDLAMYSFFLGSGDNARSIANRWGVRWVIACDGFGGVAAPFEWKLQHGQPPSWLTPVGQVGSGARIFETVDQSGHPAVAS
jgi:hypothetical protein